MTTPTEALKIARDALADMIRAGKQAKVDLTTGIRDGEPVHPVSASLTFPLATAINAIAAIDALAQQASVPSVEPAAVDMVLHCPKCGKKFRVHLAVRDHMRDKHAPKAAPTGSAG